MDRSGIPLQAQRDEISRCGFTETAQEVLPGTAVPYSR